MDLADAFDRYASCPEQTALLQGGWRLWRSRCGAIVPYRLHFGTALVPGPPLCAEAAASAALGQFLAASAARRWHLVFAPVGLNFARMAVAAGAAAWKLGEEPVVDLAAWSVAGRAGAKLRAALHRAESLGVSAAEWPAETVRGARGEELRAVHAAWLRGRGGTALGFVLGGDPLRPQGGRRWWVAERKGQAAAFVVTQALPARDAFAVQHFVRLPGAAYGAVEAALMAALRQHMEEGVRLGLLALAPLRGLERDDPLSGPLLLGRNDRGHRVMLAALRLLRHQGAWLYPAHALEHFKRKFAPTYWEPAYLVHFPGRLLPRMAVAAAAELIPGGPAAWVRLGAGIAAVGLNGRGAKR